MVALTLRNVKGSELTFTEVDNNFTALNSTVTASLAAAGTTQGTAAAITSNTTFVTSSSGSAYCVVMPTPDTGERYTIVNHTANAINVYAASGHNMDGVTDGFIQVSPGNAVDLVADSTTGWTGVMLDIWDDENQKITVPVHASQPPAPPDGNLNIFARSVGGRAMLAQIGPSGLDTALQPLLARNKVGYWNPPGNATTVPGVFGFTALSTTGTATARNVATTNVLTRMRRIGYVSATTAGSLAAARVTVAQFTTGDGAGLGGFTWIARFATSDAAAVSGARAFIGVSSSTAAATNVEPNTRTNSIGMAQLSTDNTQWYLVYGGSAAQTEIALGTGLGAPTLTNTAFELALFSPPSLNGVVYYQATNIGTGVTVSGTLSGTPGTTTPASTTLLTHQLWRTNNATALAVGLDICSIYIETDQ